MKKKNKTRKKKTKATRHKHSKKKREKNDFGKKNRSNLNGLNITYRTRGGYKTRRKMIKHIQSHWQRLTHSLSHTHTH